MNLSQIQIYSLKQKFHYEKNAAFIKSSVFKNRMIEYRLIKKRTIVTELQARNAKIM